MNGVTYEFDSFVRDVLALLNDPEFNPSPSQFVEVPPLEVPAQPVPEPQASSTTKEEEIMTSKQTETPQGETGSTPNSDTKPGLWKTSKPFLMKGGWLVLTALAAATGVVAANKYAGKKNAPTA